MKLLFVADPLATFKTYKDSTFAMMREAARRGHELWACEAREMGWMQDHPVSTAGRRIRLTGDETAWFTVEEEARIALRDVDAVIMRKDPPFDTEYLYATHLLTQAEREGARVFNRAQALREQVAALLEHAAGLALQPALHQLAHLRFAQPAPGGGREGRGRTGWAAAAWRILTAGHRSGRRALPCWKR